jgi:hypothetical protein
MPVEIKPGALGSTLNAIHGTVKIEAKASEFGIWNGRD